MIRPSVVHERLERWGAPPSQARLAALAVHGRDQEPAYLREVAERANMADIAWYAPAAPGRSWYPARFTEPLSANEPFLSAALDVLDVVLDLAGQEGFDPERIVLVGFSQGACLLTEHLVRRPRRYGGAALLTGGFAGEPGVVREVAGRLDGVPVLIASSIRDTWVPVERVQETAVLLRGAGAEVDAHLDEDPEHHVNDATVTAVRALLTRAGR